VYEELLSVSERFGSIPSQGEALTHIATSQLLEGDLLLGRETMRRAREVIDRLGTAHRTHKFVAISRAIFIAYLLDDDWEPLAAEAWEFATSNAARRSPAGMVAATMAALSMGRAGDTAGAGAVLNHITPIAGRRLLTAYAQNIVVTFAAVVTWELEAVEHASTYRNLTLQLLEAGIRYDCFGPLELLVARMSSLLGDFSQAQDYFERAKRRLDEQGAAYLEPIMEYDQACSLIRAGVTDHARVVGLLDAALEGFRSHGMLGWVKRAAERKEALPAIP